MKKDKFSFLCIYVSLVLLSVLLYIPAVKANPVIMPLIPWGSDPFFCILYVTVLFLIGMSIEYSYFKRVLSREVTPQVRKNRVLFLLILKINLVTYPLTQILAYIVYIFVNLLFWLMIFLIEILVVVIEWKLLRIEFFRVYERTFESKELLQDTTTANFFSFLIGLIGFVLLMI